MSIDLTYFRNRIVEGLVNVKAAIAEANSASATVMLDQSSVGRLSRMDAMQQQAIAQGIRERQEMQKAKLEAALARIDSGSFGACCECGEPVEAERLALDPSVVFCLTCQGERSKG